MVRVFCSLFVAGLLGCGDSSSSGAPDAAADLSVAASPDLATAPATGSASVQGTVNGKAFTPLDAVSMNTSAMVNGKTSAAGNVFVETTAGLCARINATGELEPANVHALQVQVFVGAAFGERAAPTAPGTFPISAGGPGQNAALAVYLETDASCQPVSGTKTVATSGTITVTAVGPGGYKGSGDVTFKSGDHITFTFDAPNCMLAPTGNGCH